MITIKTINKPSMQVLREKNYPDWKRLVETYDKWDAATKNKDFYYSEYFERIIQKIHKRNGISES